MSWLILLVAGLTEVGWAVGLKYTQGFTRPVPTALTVTAMVVSLWLLGLAVRTLPLGIAYAICAGIGTVGTVAVGIMAVWRASQRRPTVVRRADRARDRRAVAGHAVRSHRPAMEPAGGCGLSVRRVSPGREFRPPGSPASAR